MWRLSRDQKNRRSRHDNLPMKLRLQVIQSTDKNTITEVDSTFFLKTFCSFFYSAANSSVQISWRTTKSCLVWTISERFKHARHWYDQTLKLFCMKIQIRGWQALLKKLWVQFILISLGQMRQKSKKQVFVTI